MRKFLYSIFILLLCARCAVADTSFRDIIRAEDRRDVAALKVFLKHRDAAIRARAVRALGRVQDAALIPLFLDLARHDVSPVRMEAIFALGQTAASAAESPLSDLLADADRVESRSAILVALGKTAGTSGRGVNLLFAALGAPDAMEVKAAASALEDFAWRNRRALPRWEASVEQVRRVLPLLADARPADLRAAGAGVLWRFAWTPVNEPRSSVVWRDAVRDALVACLRDGDPNVRMRTLQAVGEIFAPAATLGVKSAGAPTVSNLSPAGDELPDRVGAMLNDVDWRVRVAAVEAIGRAAPDRAWPLLLEDRLQDPHPLVALASLRSLETLAHRHHKSTPGRGIYGVFLNGHMPLQVRAEALRIAVEFQSFDQLPAPQPFGPIGYPSKARPFEIDTKWSQIWQLRRAVAQGSVQYLTRVAREDAASDRLLSEYQAVVRPFLRDTDARVREALVESMGPLLTLAVASKADGFASALRTDLLAAMHDGDFVVRATAAESLADAGVRDAVPPILDTLQAFKSRSDVDVVTSLIESLGKLKDDRALPLLRQFVVDDDVTVCRLAARAIGDISGQAVVLAASPRQPEVPQEALDFIDRCGARPPRAILHTSRGDLTLQFNVVEAPLTVWNFVRLARARYFDGLTFHRVVPNFVVQGGDPRGDGSGGPGYTIRCEYNPLVYDRGAVGMALSGKDTGGSQFFITHSPQPRLNGRYTLFGRLVSGDAVLDSLCEGDVIRSVDIVDVK